MTPADRFRFAEGAELPPELKAMNAAMDMVFGTINAAPLESPPGDASALAVTPPRPAVAAPSRSDVIRGIENQIWAVPQWDCVEAAESLLCPMMAVLERHYDEDNPKLQRVRELYEQLMASLMEADLS